MKVDATLPDDLIACSCPQEHDRTGLIGEIVSEYARAYTTLFLKRYRRQLKNESEGLIDIIEAWRDSEADFAKDWNPVFGPIRLNVLNGASSPLEAAANLGLHLSFNGVRGAWSVRLGESTALRCAYIALPKTRELALKRQGTECAVALSTGPKKKKTYLFPRSKGAWEAVGLSPLPSLRASDNNITLLAHRNARGRDRLNSGRKDSYGGEVRDSLAALRQGFDLLEDHAPEYLTWVARVVREIIPLDRNDGFIRSHSSEELPGSIALSLPEKPAAVAEMLVHEASHQYFHIARRMEPVHDERDRRLYYSIVKGRDRSIDMILLAFHAFANVALFYRACIGSEIADGGYCAKNLERHLGELRLLVAHLEGPNSLTATGTLLWKPLARRLFADSAPH